MENFLLKYGIPSMTPNVSAISNLSEHFAAIDGSSSEAISMDFINQEIVALDEKIKIDETTLSSNYDVCEGAGILQLNEVYRITTPTTIHSRHPSILDEMQVSNRGSCTYGFAFEPDELGIWFLVTGTTTGNLLEVTTTSFDDIFTAELMVFTGNSCDQLDCVASNYNSVQWDSIPDTDFYILVHGWNNEVRDFELDVREGEIQPNDSCEGAIELNPKNNDDLLALNNYFSTPESNIEQSYCDIYNNENGIWFLVIGTGNNIEASTCNHITNFDTKLSILSGSSCGELTCVTSNDNDAGCGEQSTVTWESTLNVPYYVLVRGSSMHDIGNFGISVREVDVGHDCENEEVDKDPEIVKAKVQSNDLCTGARLLELQNDNEVYTSNNYLATAEDDMEEDYCGVLSDEVGVWFRVVGTGNAIEASTCNNFTDFDTKLSVFYGSSCDELTCVISNDDSPNCGEQSTAVWESIKDVDYYILVRGYADEYGEIGITVRETELQSNDACSGAKALDLNSNQVYTSNNYFATPESSMEEVYCDISHEEIGLWFSITGTGHVIEASTCNDVTEIDTKISVFFGHCNNELTCVVSNDDAEDCEEFSTVAWKSELNVVYYILVRGSDTDDIGDFGLTVKEMPILTAEYETPQRYNSLASIGKI